MQGLNEVKFDRDKRAGLMVARFPVRLHSIGSALFPGQKSEDGG